MTKKENEMNREMVDHMLARAEKMEAALKSIAETDSPDTFEDPAMICQELIELATYALQEGESSKEAP